MKFEILQPAVFCKKCTKFLFYLFSCDSSEHHHSLSAYICLCFVGGNVNKANCCCASLKHISSPVIYPQSLPVQMTVSPCCRVLLSPGRAAAAQPWLGQSLGRVWGAALQEQEPLSLWGRKVDLGSGGCRKPMGKVPGQGFY